MQETARLLAVAVVVLTSSLNLHAAGLAGVTMPDSVQVGSTTLVLNGMGLRTKFMIKVYVAGLYVERKSSDAGAILKTEAPKRLVMQFLHGASKNQMMDAFDDSFKDNSPDARNSMKADIDRFFAALEPLKEGDQMMFTYLPGTGTTFSVNGREKLTLAGAMFGEMIFSVWLGPKPPNADLKKGILGKRA